MIQLDDSFELVLDSSVKPVSVEIRKRNAELVFPKITAIIPAYNEAGYIEGALLKVIGTLSSISSSFEVIVAEDGSIDGTYDVCKRISGEYPFVKCLHSGERLGKGGALKAAIQEARGEYVLIIDADLPVNLNDISFLVAPLEDGVSMVLGSRYVEGSVVKRSRFREFKSRLYNSLVNLLFGNGVRDHQCGFKAFNRGVVAPLIDGMGDCGFFFDTELVTCARRSGLDVVEVPVEWVEPEGRTSKVNLVDELRILFGLFSFYLGYVKEDVRGWLGFL